MNDKPNYFQLTLPHPFFDTFHPLPSEVCESQTDQPPSDETVGNSSNLQPLWIGFETLLAEVEFAAKP